MQQCRERERECGLLLRRSEAGTRERKMKVGLDRKRKKLRE